MNRGIRSKTFLNMQRNKRGDATVTWWMMNEIIELFPMGAE
jgi:hypothetical protein